jgi:hypothetical protein
MQLPFSTEQFFEVIRNYNNTVWPAQVALTALAIVAIGLLWSRQAWATRAVWLVLALLWAWVATAYHLAFFTSINPAAYAFGVLFYVGSAVFVWSAFRPSNLTFSPKRDARTAVGFALLLYAVVVYPIWSSFTGHAYPNLPTFGLPCPTTIFTIGMLALVRGGRVWPLFVAPVIWGLIGVQAAFLLAVLPDLGLGVAAVIGMVLAVRSRRAFSPRPA